MAWQFKDNPQAGKLKFFGTRPNWVVSYIAYAKFHSLRLIFHSPGQIFTHIGEQASASFPAWSFFMGTVTCLFNVVKTRAADDLGPIEI